jgi:hypothetical protein
MIRRMRAKKDRLNLTSSGGAKRSTVTGLGKPYRRVKDAGSVQLHATSEVADRLSTTQLAFEPTAAYLAEVVAGLGFPWDEVRSLREWLTEYYHCPEH